MHILYNIFLRLYAAGIFIASIFNPKASLWFHGRKSIFDRLKKSVSGSSKIIWVHCASLGEFEQGRPLIEKLRKEYPDSHLLLTFFSPSGYEIRKNYSGVDWVYYLPLDTISNVKKFINIVNPSLAIFVKYEYWYNYLQRLKVAGIPVILISAIFRKESIFFKRYGGLYRRMLCFYNHIFVQDEESRKLASNIIPTEKITVAGDTRFDRVLEIAHGFQPIETIEKFVNQRPAIIAGSTWPDDEINLQKLLENSDNNVSFIIAPHEINESHIQSLKVLFHNHVLFSDIEKMPLHELYQKRVLIINNIGMLSRLYYYADICYIGGGFNKSGIHNTLEAAVYSKPVVFGPNFEKFAEAKNLIKQQGAFSYKTADELILIVTQLLNGKEKLQLSGSRAGAYVKNNEGATKIIMNYIRRIYGE